MAWGVRERGGDPAHGVGDVKVYDGKNHAVEAFMNPRWEAQWRLG
jgi:hypothetical protein